MRISELCENIDFEKDRNPSDKDGLGFDLKDDLIFFMENDDDVYRRHTYPAILKLQDAISSGKKADKILFTDTVKECYEIYQSIFKDHKLPVQLDEKTIEEVCQSLLDQEAKRIEEGYYEAR